MSTAKNALARYVSTQQSHHYVDIRAGYGRGGIQTVLLLNGGAAVALLTFLGNLAIANHTSALSGHLLAIESAFSLLAIGVILAALSYLAAFAAQTEHMRNAEGRRARRLRALGIGMVLASLACFPVGIAVAAHALLGAF